MLSPLNTFVTKAFEWKNLEVIRMKNTEVFQKGCDEWGVIKGTSMYSYQGCNKAVFYSKYL